MKKIILFSLIALCFTACQSEPGGSLRETDLMPYGIPVSIMAPDSAEIKADDLGGGLIKDVTIRGKDNYNVQVFATQAETSDMARIKAGQLADVKSIRFFEKIINEEEDGFIYQTAIDSNNISYNFRYIVLQGDLEIIFQAGFLGTFSQEEAERMYQAVQQ
ncbi:MAG: hypothetical protein H6573_03450 [Lewinellaceae bacterium]|nr:hypothetical protein [Phaeodactylibacter sp.]MCB0615354.1 hypothetical protein [Phaeodactylibacter sp.]MCB9346551.1 hypothetical protein [Lewinellaceae bacterium]